jgi:carboxyl-terminal processing protease
MKLKSRFLIVALCVIALGVLAGGWAERAKSRHQAAAAATGVVTEEDKVARSFTGALEVVERHYAMETDNERLTKAAVLGMLHVLDPHSSFFDRREFTEMQEEQSSRFYGIGVTINQRNNRIAVLGVVKGMPADRAGLKYGDIIVEVDGKSTKGWTQGDALKHIRGERGSEVEIAVERAGAAQPVKVHITRDEVPYPSVRNHFIIRPGVGYVALTGGFNQRTSEELREALAELRQQGMTSLILDLRRNPGGLLKQAIEVSEEFLPREMEVVTVRGREGRVRSQTYRSGNTEPQTLPLVVLINRESASASEIVAGAIQDKDRGLIVGEESFGKGLVQTVFRLPGGTGLTLTTAKYYTPSGRSIQREYTGVGLYDYYFARRHNAEAANGDKPAPTPEPRGGTVYTPTGRALHGGGGITPDIVVKANQENIALRDAAFEFARQLAAGTIPGLGEYKVTKIDPHYRLRGNEFQITEQALAAFRNFLRERRDLEVSEAQANVNLDYVRRRIRAELITAAYGLDVEDQFLLDSDAQVLAAIEALPKARQLSNTARLFAPER